jgi:nucleoside-diphosphate-sugar epimerase
MSNELHVIFGAGPVGLAVMDELVTQGKQVRIVNRRGVKDLPREVENCTGDILSADFAQTASAGATHVYDVVNPPYDKWPEMFPPLQDAVVGAAVAAKAKLIAIDNLYMYGETGGAPMTESTPNKAQTVKGKLRAKMAEDLMAVHRSGKIPVVIARASDYVGPRVLESAMGSRVIYAALAGKTASVLGNPNLPHTYTYIKDVGKALVTLGQHNDAFGQIWHIPSAETLTTRQFIERIFAEIGKPAKISAAPKLALKLLGMINPMIHSVAEMVYQFEQPFILDGSKYVRTFGIQATPLDEVIRKTIAWYRENPQTK